MILVTGGLGYIGSHTCVVLAQAGYDLFIVDNLSNAKLQALDRVRELAPGRRIDFACIDLRDRAALESAFAGRDIEAVVHFAGLKAVGESVEKPLLYYENNVGGTFVLLAAMQAHGVRRIVFSSSATVYGDPERLPIAETHPLRATNPYGRTKLIVEQVLADQAAAQAGFVHASLRYFNPTGAHPSGRIGEDPRGVPNNLFPYIARVAAGRLEKLHVWGSDYATPDGTGVRDYLHVMDLARGHVAALEYLVKRSRSIIANLGTGRGYSVLEAVRAFEKASGRAIPLQMAARRSGDVAQCYADPSLAARELGWRTELDLAAMCRDAWRWQAANPDGYV
ncbi:MAG TPA: UDP-glucose 4-epimerase GalE [Burkholderiales bacterium]|nr:UDP-glucose 4-epimerase GalE [Burkholderiales bacterium]